MIQLAGFQVGIYGRRRTLGEELSVSLDKLAGHGGTGQLDQGVSLVALVRAHGDFLDLVDGHLGGFPQTLDDDLRADTLFHVLLDLLENLAGQNNNRGSAISNLSVLRSCNIDQDAGSGVNDVEELHGVSGCVLRVRIDGKRGRGQAIPS